MPQRVKTRNVSLTPEIEVFIDDRVASGRFRSASEVVGTALRLLEDEERPREIQPGKLRWEPSAPARPSIGLEP